MHNSRNKQLTKNTVFLYCRMLLLLLISFYTSRILLEKLGVDDFGIYNVVGSIVAILSSLRSIFATSTQRFINIAIGQNRFNEINNILFTSLQVNLIVCIIFTIVAEVLGMWFINCKLNIPSSRIQAAHIVFQFSVFTSLVTIFQITFDAVIIAFERMQFYAYISIVEAILKLAIIFLLNRSSFDNLILYAALLFIIAVIILISSITYSRYALNLHIRKKTASPKQGLLKNMLTFSGWNFFGNFMYSLVNEGINFLLNIFGGVMLNAARAIAYQVRNAIMMFLANMQIAVQPQMIQSYGEGDHHRFRKLLFFTSRILFYIFIVLAMPILFYTREILEFWLTNVPPDASVFIQALLAYMMIRSLHGPIDLFFKAYGRLRTYQLIETCMFAIPLFTTYILLSLGLPPYTSFLAMACVEIINLYLILRVARSYDAATFKDYEKDILLRCIMTLGITVFTNYILSLIHIHFFAHIILSIITSILCIGIIGCKDGELKFIQQLILKKR